MSTSPYTGERLIPRGISLIDPRSGFKKYQPKKAWKPNVRFTFHQDTSSDWNSNTLEGLTVSGGNVSLSSGSTYGSMITYCINPTGAYPTDATKAQGRRDIRDIRLNWNSTTNDGEIYFYASNDGGKHWIEIVNKNLIYHLQSIEQSKYWDLRLRTKIYRKWPGQTSPVLNMWTATFDLKGVRYNLS